ncbi:MAG: ATP synthase F0 subunit B [Bdellovibrionota bacterium]
MIQDVGHANEIPFVTVWQFINLAILFSVLIYLLKDNVRKFFSDKRTVFLTEAEKSKVAQAEAEKGYLEIKKKLEDFNRGVETSSLRARTEAQELKKQMISDAKSQAQKIKDEALVSAKNETMKAQRKLHQQVVSEVISLSRAVLAKDIGNVDHQKLQSEFSKNIQAVNP